MKKVVAWVGLIASGSVLITASPWMISGLTSAVDAYKLDQLDGITLLFVLWIMICSAKLVGHLAQTHIQMFARLV